MGALLTRGAVATIAVSEMWVVVSAARQAVLQVVDVSWVVEPPFDHNGRCRPSRRRPNRVSPVMVLTDGVHTLGQFSLSTPVEGYVRNGRIRKGTVLRLHHFCCNVFRTDKIIIFSFEVLQTECELIGTPTPYQRGLEHGDSDGNAAVRSSTSSGRRTIVVSPFLRP